MNEDGKSDKPVVPGKPPNKGRDASRLAEGVEERGLANGNPSQQNRVRAQDRDALQHALERIRQAAAQDRRLQFTTLWHHVYDLRRLRQAYFDLKQRAAPGVDGETWQHYGEVLEENLQGLSEQLKRGAYKAKPVRRAYIPKDDGRKRPIGIPTLEDKIVQRATTKVLEAIYEVDFAGFSYGFRPTRSQHNALDAVTVGIKRRRVNWILDADIRSFFDTIDHGCLMKFLEIRIRDQRVLRHIRKWLNAGVLEDGQHRVLEEGTPQGGSISPLLANIYLHYVLDGWASHWRRVRTHGDMFIVRFADDFLLGFQHRSDAETFLADVRIRFRAHSLELHPDKTRLVEFGRFAAENRRRRGEGKPETFDFLGFTHICGKTRAGAFQVLRKTMRKRVQRKLKELKCELRRRMHKSVPDVGRWLGSVVRGHGNYYAVPDNLACVRSFRYQVGRLWFKTLRRRSHKHRLGWVRMTRLVDRWLPTSRIHHPYPEQRLRVITEGRSPVR